MREIKFRAWYLNYDTSKFEMLGWSAFFFSDASPVVGFDAWNGFPAPDDPNIILMQYTGLKDKNGKEIYEGDIVRKTFWNSIPCKRIDIIKIPDCYYHTFTGMQDEEFEVIGNIYENPELLGAR